MVSHVRQATPVSRPPEVANVLSIAGSDPSGGAGIQADLKSFAARGTYGMAVLTALTAQNTRGVFGVEVLPAAFVAAQLRAVLEDVEVGAIKIGMVATGAIAEALAEGLVAGLAGRRPTPIVLDPVMVAKGGSALLDPEAVQALVRRLLPLASLVTPNLPEAARLLGEDEARDRRTMEDQARRLQAGGAGAVLLKGGHLPSGDSPDLLVSATETHWLEGPRLATRNTHGTGCSLSSAIAAELAKGEDLVMAVHTAKHWLTGAIATADKLRVGSGHGPVNHFHGLWQAPVPTDPPAP